METLTLDTAFVSQGIPHVAFWNGRVLTAEDLRAEQAAQQLGRNRLGRAIGPGVVSGLAVLRRSDGTADQSRVEVTAGLAVDRLGQAIELPVDVTLSLVVPTTTAHGDGVFTVCGPIPSSNPTGTGTGVYLLLMRAASDSLSSVSGVPALGSGVAAECGPRYTVDGVSFRLVRVDPGPLAEAAGHDDDDRDDLATLGTTGVTARARNVLAHLFLDTRAWASRFTDPFSADPTSVTPGALATLSAGPVVDCEVPIALLTWASGGVQLVDVWSVRRPPAVTGELTAVQGLATHRRAQLGRASYCQFQDQLATVLEELPASQVTNFRLVDRFRYLPAAGLVPLARGTRRGFAVPRVLEGLPTRTPVALDPSRVGALLDESVHHAAVDTDAGELLNIYSIMVPGSQTVDHLVFSTSRIDLIDDDLRIEAVFPAGMLFLGQQIRVLGRNFGYFAGECRVTIGETLVNPVTGSTDSLLLLTVPNTLEVEPAGTRLMLTVSRTRDSDTVPLLVGYPEQDVTGKLHVHWLDADPRKISSGDPLLLKYVVRSALDRHADITLQVTGAAELVASATLHDKLGDPFDGPVPLEPEAEVEVQVRIPEVRAGGSFIIGLRASAGEVVDDDIRPFSTKPNQPAVPSNPAIRIETLELDLSAAGSKSTKDGSTIRLADHNRVDLKGRVVFTESGTYVARMKPSPGAHEPIQSGITEPDEVGNLNRFVDIVVPPGGSTDASLILSFRLSPEVPADGVVKPTNYTVTVSPDDDRDGTSRTYVLQSP